MTGEPVQPGVSADLVSTRPLAAEELGAAIDAVAGALDEAFVSRWRLLDGGEPDRARTERLLRLQRAALDLGDEPERAAKVIIGLLHEDFASDSGAHEVVVAGDAFMWALRDLLGPRFGAAASTAVQEAQAILLGLTQRMVRHQTGEFPTDPHFQRRTPDASPPA